MLSFTAQMALPTELVVLRSGAQLHAVSVAHRLVKLTETGICDGYQGLGRGAGVVYKMKTVQDVGCGDGCTGRRYAEQH